LGAQGTIQNSLAIGSSIATLSTQSGVSASLASGADKVYLTSVFQFTSNECIKESVQNFGGQVLMTSSECLSGTDRLAEAKLQLNCYPKIFISSGKKWLK